MEKKVCTSCGVNKQVSSFYIGSYRKNKDGTDYIYPTCKKCKRKADAEYRKTSNKEEVKEYKRLYYIRNRERLLEESRRKRSSDQGKYLRYIRDIKNKYGLLEEDLRDLMDKQKGLCAICKSSLLVPEETARLGFAVDHCHTTSKVRGLLCDSCNIGLGKFKDDQELLFNAYNYLKITGGFI